MFYYIVKIIIQLSFDIKIIGLVLTYEYWNITICIIKENHYTVTLD